ncbi:sugar ABC transporter ATP-binding protein [Streptomyces sp. ODS28]|uniref:sugar ABC transporter ATP-binding protein n=1 Tax=Streptomyces sp. ODS28 TaxID=3136688 RepID=UPI0031EEC650
MADQRADDHGATAGTPGGTGPPLLRVDGVAKRFPGVQALRDMHLDLRHGEVLALVGENGAGKSTLMKLLSGVHAPDEGTFALDGRPVTVRGPRHARELGISIIHQEFHLMPDLTVAQNIFIGREPRGRFLLRDRELDERAGQLMDRLGLPLDPRRRVAELTVAQQQMVEIAKALSYEAKVLIMDEPTAALNDAEVEVLHGLIRRFVRPGTAPEPGTPEKKSGSGTGVIYISHRMDELRSLTDRITVIRDGRYVDTLDTASASMEDVISRMVGRELDPGATSAPIGATGSTGATGAAPVGVRHDRDTVLEVRGLSTKTLLRNVDLDLQRGEILGLAGLMGAGRTELARALVGADPVESGTVTLNGRRITVRNPADAARHRIGYLAEDRKNLGLMLDEDVNANIGLGALGELFQSFGFVKDRAMRARSEQQVAALRIRTPSLDQPVRQLSGGNQQKVVLARWLVKDCDVLIVDEPTRGIDVGAKEEIYGLLNALAAQGKSIVMISSELPEVLRMAHRVVVMSEGHVTGRLTAEEATQERVMEYATRRPATAGAPSPTATPSETGAPSDTGTLPTERR